MDVRLVAAAVLLLLLLSLRADGSAVNVDIGRGVDVLQRFGIIGDMLFGDALYGDVSNGEDTRTHDVFNDADRFTEVFNLSNSNSNLLNLTFCPDLDCLFNVYFDGFHVELSEAPWKLLTTSRQSHFISERFGVPEMAMELGQNFVIVSYKRSVKRIKMIGNLTQLAELNPTMVEKLKCTSIGIESMVTDFITEFGSHYIDEYTVGDSVFQVLVYLPVFYNRFYNTCALNNCSESETTKWLSPTFTEYQGQVMRVGLNDAVDKWINSNLQLDSKFGETYVSLYALKNRPDLCNDMVALMDDRAVVGVNLKVISTFIADPVKRRWFREVLDNHVKLREVNL